MRLPTLLLIAAGTTSGASAPQAKDDLVYDLWIRDGTVIDGTGRGRFRADILVFADTIAVVADPGAKVKARETLDATGKLIVPGFIDTHAHGDPLRSPLTNFLAQGITTVVLGQDGGTPGVLDPTRTTLAQWMRQVDLHRSEVNVALLSGHGSLRTRAGVGNSREVSRAQLEAMKELLRTDFAAGVFGLSFGLEYEPGRYSQSAEVKALGDLVGSLGGVVMSHMRSEDAGRIAVAIDEMLLIDGRVHVSHLKIVTGRSVHEAHAVLDQLARARASGRAISADVYPYTASASDLVFLYPGWAKTREQYEYAVRERRAELEAHIRKRLDERNGPEAILFLSGPFAGQRLADVARDVGSPPEKVVIDEIGYGGPEQAHFLMTPAVQDVFVTADHVNICTDGAPGLGHPRSYDSFVKTLVEHVGPPPKMTFEQAIHKMTGMPAAVLGLDDRGVLSPGAKADLLVISPDRLRTRATWNDQQRSPEGIDLVLVNGRVAFESGSATGARHGRMLRFGRTVPRPDAARYGGAR